MLATSDVISEPREAEGSKFSGVDTCELGSRCRRVEDSSLNKGPPVPWARLRPDWYFPRVWVVDNRTNFAADRNWVRDSKGTHHFVVAVRVSIRIDSAGKGHLADEQEPVVVAPDYLGDDGLSSMRAESDLGFPKPATDVLVHGAAHAPGGRPVPEVPVALHVGPVKKTLLVRGENAIVLGPSGPATTAPRPFTTMPVCWERAFGGFDDRDPDPARQKLFPDNPVGVGVAVRSSDLENSPGPNIVYPGDGFGERAAGLLPVASHWSPRRELGGTYDAKWIEEQAPLLPKDLDPRHALTAPVDQQLPTYLRPGTPIEVVNMCPEGVFRFEVPRIHFGFETRFGFKRVRHRGNLSTVLVEPETREVRLTWQTSLEVAPRDVDYLDATTVTLKEFVG